MKKRFVELDYFKGILVIFMVLCHCIQFFGHEGEIVQGTITTIINLTTFSGFFFAFGYAHQLSYLDKDYKAVVGRMLIGTVKILIAYYISGICFYAFAKDMIYNPDTVLDVILFRAFPGWSEFLVSFVMLNLLVIIFFKLIKKANYVVLIIWAAVSVLLCFIPYEAVTSSVLSLFIGSTHFVTFPVLQYSVFYIAGVVVAKKGLKPNFKMFIISLIPTVAFIVYYAVGGHQPSRFPPHFLYIFGSALVLVFYFFVSYKLLRFKDTRVVKLLEQFGGDSLYYLLISNILIFALSGSSFSYRSFGYATISWIILLAVSVYIKTLVAKLNKN